MAAGARAFNSAVFFSSVAITGAIAGAIVWAVLSLIDAGISALWSRFPEHLGSIYPLIVCISGGLVIGLFAKRFGQYPENLPEVMAKVKATGRYEYDRLGVMAAGAALPLIFGGSVGNEAGLVGVIAALCTWVGDRLKRLGEDLRDLTELGMYAALSAVFTAPLLGFADVPRDDSVGRRIALSGWVKVATYAIAVIGALGAVYLLSSHLGGGMSMPRYDRMDAGLREVLLFIPVCLIGALGGWLYRNLCTVFGRLSELFGSRCVSRAVVCGAILGICGLVLPFTLFSGEVQAGILDSQWMGMSAAVLLATGFVKIAATAFCLNMGWRGGHLFPSIFAGISIGYGLAAAFGADPMFSVCVATSALLGGVTRKPLLAVLLLFLCFPVHGLIPLVASVLVGVYLPLPDLENGRSEARADPGER